MILNPGNVYRESTHNIYCYRGGNPLLLHTSGYHLPSSLGLSTPSPYSIRVTIDNSTDTTHSYPHNPSPSSLASYDYTLKVRAIWLTHLAPLTISSHSSSRLFVQNIGWRQFVALSLIHVYIVVGCTKRGGVSMCHYHWYRYILSPATVYADSDICWRQFVQHVLSSATIYAGDNIYRNSVHDKNAWAGKHYYHYNDFRLGGCEWNFSITWRHECVIMWLKEICEPQI